MRSRPREALDDDIAVRVGEMHEHETVLRVLRVESEREQPALAVGRYVAGDVEERRREQRAVLVDADAAWPLGDEDPRGVPGRRGEEDRLIEPAADHLHESQRERAQRIVVHRHGRGLAQRDGHRLDRHGRTHHELACEHRLGADGVLARGEAERSARGHELAYPARRHCDVRIGVRGQPQNLDVHRSRLRRGGTVPPGQLETAKAIAESSSTRERRRAEPVIRPFACLAEATNDSGVSELQEAGSTRSPLAPPRIRACERALSAGRGANSLQTPLKRSLRP